jgi:SAM-dependent methyltransferase
MSRGRPPESQRLAEVYARYQRDPALADKWDESNAGNRSILVERRSVVQHLLRTHGVSNLTGLRILDLGCGRGRGLSELVANGADPRDLCGVDILADSVAEARLAHADVLLAVADGAALCFPPRTFDVVVCYTVFSSVLDDEIAGAIATEIDRVLRPGGILLWYDLRLDNPRNPNVRPVKEADLRRLFPEMRRTLRSATVLPPLVRKLGVLTRVSYRLLAKVPPLKTHYVALMVKD